MTRYTTMIEEKNTTIENLHNDKSRHNTDFEHLNKQILAKLNSISQRPQKQDLGELKDLLTSVNKLEKEISILKQNNRDFVSKHDDNIYQLKDQIVKATNEMKNSKKVETVIKTIREPQPIRERIVHAPPVKERIIRTAPVVRVSRSPGRVFREIPKQSVSHHHGRCTCSCGMRGGVETLKHSRYDVEKCPICNVGYVNTVNNSVRDTRINQNSNFYREEQKNTNKMYVEPLVGKTYQSRVSNEVPLKTSGFSNNYVVENSLVSRNPPTRFRKPQRYSVEPIRNQIINLLPKKTGERKSVRELEKQLVSQRMTESEQVTDVQVRTSTTRR